MSTQTTNEFGGEFGGITLLGKAHSLSALFIVLLRAAIGGMILFAGRAGFSVQRNGIILAQRLIASTAL